MYMCVNVCAISSTEEAIVFICRDHDSCHRNSVICVNLCVRFIWILHVMCAHIHAHVYIYIYTLWFTTREVEYFSPWIATSGVGAVTRLRQVVSVVV
jgi:hypothetical protein